VKVYQVGGCVRDGLLGLPVKDRDWVVVGATAGEMRALGFRQVGKDFPVFLHPETHEEYALARTERKTGPGYHGFTVHASPEVPLEEDLRRRDLTINAMARAEDGTLVDPFGGREDLAHGVLRHVSPAFVEDPVRILRVARFAARYGFSVAQETGALLEAMVRAGEVDALVPERVWAELQAALGEREPPRFFAVLRDCGALARLLPEIEALFGVPQPAEHHPEVDTGEHVMRVLEQAARLSREPVVRFAALVHDLGKGATPRSEWPRHIGHEERGVALVEGLCDRFRAPREYRELGVLTARFHGRCHRALELRAATVVDLLERLDALRRPERFERFLLACEADFRGRPGWEGRPYPPADHLREAREAAAGVDPRGLLSAGLNGTALAEALRQARIDAVRALGSPGATAR
jgi:tRNA nucleotidyltransferase (CCA-adding enzyme)